MLYINRKYSTTRLISTIKPLIERHADSSAFKTTLFLPEGEGRQGEGGLRTRGQFKHSYEVIKDRWYITDNFGVSEKTAQQIPIDESHMPANLADYEQSELNKPDSTSFQPAHLKLPLITVITVVFNRAKYLEGTIQSVINQTYGNVEYIIIDGGSTDRTLDIIRKYEHVIDYWVSEKDAGIYDAMNKGLQLSCGEMIGILNSDDWYEKKSLDLVCHNVRENNNVDLIHGAMAKWDAKGNKIALYGSRKETSKVFMPPFNHPTCFFSKKAYKKIGVFDCQYQTAADYDLMLRFKKSNLGSTYVDEIITNFRMVGVTSQKKLFPAIQIWKLLRKNQYPFHIILYAIFYRFLRSILAFVVNIFGINSFKNIIRRYLPYHKAQ